ncbi:MAG: globin domain-containing protein [Hyphomonadaceae bacterium]
MTPKQTDLIRTTYQRAKRIAPHFAATFYAELFAIDPTLRRLFSGDMVRQGAALMGSLDYVVEGVSAFESIAPALRALAQRHAGYGVEPQHYPLVGTALMRTFRHELGAEFGAEAREAWSAAYRMISETMIAAAYGPISASNPAASPRR